MPDAIVLAFRGTQVDCFWPSVIDFAVDAQFLPVRDTHGNPCLVDPARVVYLIQLYSHKARRLHSSLRLWPTSSSAFLAA
jgi:hypothetical protein